MNTLDTIKHSTQYARILNTAIEVNDFVSRNADKPYFQIMDVKIFIAPVGAASWPYPAERYAVLYRATEVLS